MTKNEIELMERMLDTLETQGKELGSELTKLRIRVVALSIIVALLALKLGFGALLKL